MAVRPAGPWPRCRHPSGGAVRWGRRRFCRGVRFAGVKLGRQPPCGGLQARGGQDCLDRHGRTIAADLGSQQPLEPFGGRGHAGAAAHGGLAQALGEAVDLDGGEIGEYLGLLQAFLMWAERPSTVTA